MAEADGSRPQKPSRESLREVKAEAKERQKAFRAGYSSVEAYHARPRRSRRAPAIIGAVAVVSAVAVAGWFLVPEWLPSPSAGEADTPKPPEVDVRQEARALMSAGPWRNWEPGIDGLEVKRPDAQPELNFTRADADTALKATMRYLEASLFDPAVLYRGELQPVLDTLGGNDRRLERSMSDADPLTPAASAYMNRFRPTWVSGTGVAPQASGVVEDAVSLRVLPGVGVQAAFKVTFRVKIAYPVVVGPDEDRVEVVVVGRQGAVRFIPGQFDTPFWDSGTWISLAGECGPSQSFTSEWVSAVPKGLLPPGKDHCFA